MGLQKVAFNFIAEQGGKLVKSLLCTKPQKAVTNIKGLVYKPLASDIVSLSVAKNPTLEKLLGMGINESNAKILVKTMPEKELLKNCELYKKYDALDGYVESALEDYNELCKIYGKSLDFGKTNSLNYITKGDIGNIELMKLTEKHRALRDFNERRIENIPDNFVMTDQDKISKCIVDNHFKSIKGTEAESMLYRGEILKRDLPYVQNLENLKEGEIFEIPGYAWVTDSKKYAFRAYAGDDVDTDFMKIFNKMSIKHIILSPKKTKLKASRPREGQEFVMCCDSKMRLVKRIINEEKREIIIYSEHVPD